MSVSTRADAVERVLQVVILVAAALAVGFLAGMARPRPNGHDGEHRAATPLDETGTGSGR